MTTGPAELVRPRLLVVEDDEYILDALVGIAASHEAKPQVDYAQTAASAIGLTATYVYDLVTLDLMIPRGRGVAGDPDAELVGNHGFLVADELMRQRRRTRIIFLTAWNDVAMATTAMTKYAPYADFLPKGSLRGSDQLRGAIASALRAAASHHK